MSLTKENEDIYNLLMQKSKEVQDDLHFFKHTRKISSSSFLEIPLTEQASIFIQKSIQKLDNLEYDLKHVIKKIKNEEGLEMLLNFFVCRDEESKAQLIEKLNEYKGNGDVPNFRAQIPKHSLERVIMPSGVKEDIRLSISLIENYKRIYDDWGFAEIEDKPKLILNFYGPPGTGKTMVSHAIAKELNKKILSVNYAEVESKYVGDAPKNLLKAFEVATKEKAVLFFDEADSFLGKRIENVSTSSDQAINSLRSQMLILLEDFDGIVIFATNLAKNYDKAFESRILKHIYFELPNKENRQQIINLMIPSRVPLSENVNKEELCLQLAEVSEGFSGREIKNAILESLSLAVQNTEETLEAITFINGFKKVKEKLRRLAEEQTKTTISRELKEKIEHKIKENLSTSNQQASQLVQ
ncbi:ATP-binding protein [Tannerella sp.]|uniref:ATP-binding protein n=1 Tax=Tannerella sp. TaxID=2382127 RepID=UPI0026DBCC28|nr:ATP-binding protein [Tannerella sp.]MDO4702828.1 ATP-binding protein [Tannerella sp.]